jgi:hypothetical protein
MWTGRRFKLRTASIGIETSEGKRIAVPVPANTVLKVISGPTEGDRMVDVMTDGKVLVMFVIDLKERGDEISDA